MWTVLIGLALIGYHQFRQEDRITNLQQRVSALDEEFHTVSAATHYR
jgi:hypothetical protein